MGMEPSEVKSRLAGKWAEAITSLCQIDPRILNGGHHPCPKCGGTKRFNLSRDGDGKAFCNDCPDGPEVASSGIDTIMWLNSWDFPRAMRELENYLDPPVLDIAEDSKAIRNETYAKLAGIFGLADHHRQALRDRGLSDYNIDTFGYWSLVGSPTMRIMREFPTGRDVIGRHVPGVFPSGFQTLAATDCMLIPVRCRDGRIIGMQYRPDKIEEGKPKYKWFSDSRKGVSSGSPCHYSMKVPGKQYRKGILRLTEGPLKADIASVYGDIRTLAIAGVQSWRSGAIQIKDVKPDFVYLAFDMDSGTKPSVAKSVVAVYDDLLAAGILVQIETWDSQHNGIDDAMAAGVPITAMPIEETKKRIDFLREVATAKPIPDQFEHPDDPHRLARVNLSKYQELGRSIRYWRGTWYSYRGTHYVEIDKDHFLARINASIKEEFDRIRAEEHVTYEKWKKSKAYDTDKDKGPPRARKVLDSLAKNVLEATKSMQIMRQAQKLDSWLSGGPDECISCENGIINVRALVSESDDQVLIDHSPNWFSTVALPYRYDPEADCPAWKSFLQDIFNGDAESIAVLQQWMGYLLVKSDNSLNKVLFVIGKPRSGKGTILNIIRAVLGEQNIATPTLSEMGEKFGLESLIGKSAALIADARMSDRTDETIVTERLLSISGNDPQNIQRKYKPTITGYRLNVRFTLFSNLIPKLKDFSSAFVTRCIFLHTPNCYLGREDVHLSGKLAAELPGILNWCIAGRQMLEDGNWRLKQPESGQSLVREMNAMTSPVRSFVDDICEVGAGLECTTSDLFRTWEVWCAENDISHPGTIQSFSRKIKAVEPLIDTSQKRFGRERFRVFLNVRERPVEESPIQSESTSMF